MGDKIKTGLKILVFFVVGIVIFWWVYKDQDIEQIKAALKNADYFWIVFSFLLAFLSHLSRARRWQLLIEPMGYRPSLQNSFFAVMIMDLSNMAVPRSGEVARCGVMSKYEKIPFTKLLGTVVIDRIFDFILLFMLLAVVLFTQFSFVRRLLDNNPEIKNKIWDIIHSVPLLVTLGVASVVAIIVAYRFRHILKNNRFYLKMREMMLNFIEGIKTVKNMERKFEFIFHSVFIWVLYFLMIYVSFWSFSFTKDMGILAALTAFVMASFGMVAPSPGGIGTWHFMVIQTLFVYGVTNKADAGAFAFAVHGSMTLFLIFLGVISVIMLPIYNRKKSPILLEKSDEEIGS
jgi:uncharacterized protein (TIRG00374 family)